MVVSVSCEANSVINGIIYFLGQNGQKEMNMTFLDLWYHWHWNQHHQWHHCICLAQIIKMRCNIGTGVCITLGHWHRNGTIAFLRSKQLKWGATWLFGHVMSLVLISVSHGTNGVSSGTTAFLRSMMIEMRCNMTFLVTDAIGTIPGITWWQQYYQWPHWFP